MNGDDDDTINWAKKPALPDNRSSTVSKKTIKRLSSTKLCQRCALQGICSALHLFQLNEEEAILMCKNAECTFMPSSNWESLIVKRNISKLSSAVTKKFSASCELSSQMSNRSTARRTVYSKFSSINPLSLWGSKQYILPGVVSVQSPDTVQDSSTQQTASGGSERKTLVPIDPFLSGHAHSFSSFETNRLEHKFQKRAAQANQISVSNSSARSDTQEIRFTALPRKPVKSEVHVAQIANRKRRPGSLDSDSFSSEGSSMESSTSTYPASEKKFNTGLGGSANKKVNTGLGGSANKKVKTSLGGSANKKVKTGLGGSANKKVKHLIVPPETLSGIINGSVKVEIRKSGKNGSAIVFRSVKKEDVVNGYSQSNAATQVPAAVGHMKAEKNGSAIVFRSVKKEGAVNGYSQSNATTQVPAAIRNMKAEKMAPSRPPKPVNLNLSSQDPAKPLNLLSQVPATIYVKEVGTQPAHPTQPVNLSHLPALSHSIADGTNPANPANSANLNSDNANNIVFQNHAFDKLEITPVGQLHEIVATQGLTQGPAALNVESLSVDPESVRSHIDAINMQFQAESIRSHINAINSHLQAITEAAGLNDMCVPIDFTELLKKFTGLPPAQSSTPALSVSGSMDGDGLVSDQPMFIPVGYMDRQTW